MDRTSDFTRYLALAGLACLAACSSYKGERYGTYVNAGETVEVQPHGIPYELSKPQFLLTVTTTTPATGPAQTTAALSYTQVPDPTQAFSIRLKPGPVSSPNFKLVFNQGGTIQSTAATVNEQVTPTITAIGSVVVSALSIVTKVAAGGNSSPNTLLAGLATDRTTPIEPLAACKKPWDYPEVAYRKALFGLASDTPSVADGIKARIASLYLSDDDLKKGFLYLTEEEKLCLGEIERADDDALAGFSSDIDKAVSKWYGNFTSDNDFVAKVKAAASADGPAITAAIAQCPKDACTPGQIIARGHVITDINNAANLVKGRADESAFLKTVIQISPDAWRALYVNFVDAELSRLDLLQLVGGSVSAPQQQAIAAYRVYLTQHQAGAMGAETLYQRSLTLQTYLAVVRDKDVQGGKAPASAEYSQYRAELDQLKTQIAALKTSTLAVLQPKVAAEPAFQNTPVCWVQDPFYVAANKDSAGNPKPWISIAEATGDQLIAACNTKTTPEYVVGLSKQ